MNNNTETMTITRGLAELKTLGDRIEKKIETSTFIVANKRSNKKINGTISLEEFSENVKSNLQSINDLISRETRIRSAIAQSNAITKVTVAGEEMTVTDAIAKKNSIEFEVSLLQELKTQFRSVVFARNKENEKVDSKLEELLLASFGREGKQKVTEEEVLAISKPFLDQNQFDMIDPISIERVIEELEEKISKFKLEIDYVLSESNSLTRIEL